MPPKILNTVDLFCGAGGATTGLELALQRLGMRHRGIAINHWKVAVDTMRINHPGVDTKCMSVEEAVPEDLVPDGIVDVLWASPSCTHHSRAKGSKPRSNQQRAQPELIFSWLDQLFVRRLIVENVPEFIDWGPLDRRGRPIKRDRGKCFYAWINGLQARNYIVEWRIVNCADYGDATIRRRFFLKAVKKGCGQIHWPEPQYAEDPQEDLFASSKKRWRGIKECLDLTDIGTSIFSRKKPLRPNTLRRISVGLRKYCGLDFQMDMLGPSGSDNCRLRGLDQPMFAQHCANRTAIVRPFIVKLNHNQTVESIDKPISTITTSGAHHLLCFPLVLDHFKGGQLHPADLPIGAQTTHDRFSLVTPLVLDQCKGGAAAPHLLPLLENGQMLDIRIRMLTPKEIAAAHSFGTDYQLVGNRAEKIKQIGNSVPVMTAAAMCFSDFCNSK